MEVRVYLCNGDVLEFSPADAAGEQAVLAELGKGRVFAERLLILGGGPSCTLVPTARVSRIDVLTDQPFSLPNALDASYLEGDAEDDFARRFADQAEPVAPGEQFDGFLEIALAGGFLCRFRWRRVLKDQLQFFTNMKRILDIPMMVFVHPRGGAILINVANVQSIATAPGFAEYPAGALPVVRLD